MCLLDLAHSEACVISSVSVLREPDCPVAVAADVHLRPHDRLENEHTALRFNLEVAVGGAEADEAALCHMQILSLVLY